MKKAGIGCGLVAAVVLLLIAAVGWPYLAIGGGAGKMPGWEDRDFDAELLELVMNQSGLDAPGAVNGFDAYVAMVGEYEGMIEGLGEAPTDPQAAARVAIGEATQADLSEPNADFVKGGQRLLEAEGVERIVAAIDALAEADGFVEPEDSRQRAPDGWLFEHGSDARGLAKLLDARVMLEAWSGDEAAAATELDRMVTVARPYLSQPALLGRLLGIAIDSLALVEVRKLAFVTEDPEVLDALEAVVDRASSGPPISYTLEGERLIGLAQLKELPAPTLPIKLLDPSVQGAVLDEFFNRAIEWANTPAKERAGQSPGAWAAGMPDSKYSVAKLLLPAIDRFLQADEVYQQELGATRLVLAIRRFEIAHGELPESLEALVPEFLEAVPTDPISGAGFVYRAEPDAHTGAPFTLYSLGLDGVDGGGKIVGPRESAGERDFDTNFTAQWVSPDH